MSLLEQVRAECDTMLAEVAGTPEAGAVREVLARIAEPIRIAVAGRVKAGKSTLVNALLGERLAATDAGECTRIPTWYRHGDSYRILAVRRDGEPRELRFSRVEGKIDIDLGPLGVEDIERIEVEWPLDTLKRWILIDTPGLASIDDEASVRTRELLGLQSDRTSQADAVLYCLRHLHRSDAEYLGAFLDHSVVGASAANAIAVLTRADEIGAGRPDALDSAIRIAKRYATDDRVRAMCSTIIPVVGLMAETGESLTESEAATIRSLAGQPDEDLAEQLVSADRFVSLEAGIPVEDRVALMDRLGIYGVRVAVGVARAAAEEGRRITAVELGHTLLGLSGFTLLANAVDQHFGPQVEALKARSSLVGLRAAAHRVAAHDPPLAQRQLGRLEALEAAAGELLAQRLRFLLASGEVRLKDEDLRRAEIFLTAPGAAQRLGLDDGADVATIRAQAELLVDRWRSLGGAGLLDPLTGEAVDGLVRIAEGLHLSLVRDGGV
jgi:GTPase Era involved in 16S rRNA processing